MGRELKPITGLQPDMNGQSAETHTWTTIWYEVSDSCVRLCTAPTPSAVSSQLLLVKSLHVEICSIVGPLSGH